MFDAFWSELLIISVVALIFLGPKDLLVLLKTLGKWTRKAQETIQLIKLSIEEETEDHPKKDD